MKPLEEKALGVQTMRKDRPEQGESEFATIAYWKSIAAISRFAGMDRRTSAI